MTTSVVPTRHWRRLDDGLVQCTLCPRECRLKEGQRGFCFVRACEGGRIVLTTFGRSSGFCVDPIEKKPLNHFLPGSAVLSFGTAGCNLGCRFCQNWDISRSREMDRLNESASPQEIARAAIDGGAASVAFTYNDPVVFHEYAVETARACRREGVRTVAVTAGYVNPAPRAEFYAEMDAANVDLKAFTESFYRDWCSASLAPILETLQYIRRETKTWLEITTLLIPGLNDGEKEIDELTGWIASELGAETPLHFTAFHPSWHLLDRDPTPVATLKRARGQARRNGLMHVYTGNVRDVEGARTLCASCGATIIERDGYEITGWALAAGGRCAACGAVCAGVFGDAPGSWNGGRRAVRF